MKLLITFLLIFSATAGWTQETLSFKGWKIGVHISPEIGYRSLDGDTSEYLVSYLLDLRSEREKPAFLFTAGLSAEYRFSKLIGIRSGIHYSLRGEKSKDLAGDEYIIYLGDISVAEKLIYRNQFHYIGIPLHANIYFLNRKKIQLFVSPGIGLDFLYLTSTVSTIKVSGEREETEFDSVFAGKQDYANYNFFNPSIIVSMGVDWHIRNKSTLRIEPIYRRSLLPLSDSPVKGIYYNLGVNIGYIYSLN